MKKRIVVIGGVAAGPKAAARARRRDPDAEITIVERGRLLSYAGCGMPYYIEGLIQESHELMETPAGTIRDVVFFKNVKDVHVLTETLAQRIDRENKTVHTVNVVTGEPAELPYDKLVIATGGMPIDPPIEGKDLNHVFRLNHPDHAIAIREAVEHGNIRRAVLVGGGLIGMETAEALFERGIEVILVEMMDQLIPNLLDWEVAAFLETYLRSKGVHIHLQEQVLSFEGDAHGTVSRVNTSKGSIEVQMVLMAIGVRPNVHLASEAGLEIGDTGAIAVNEHMQTSDPDIYAGGDCVENPHLVTGQRVYIPLGSTSNKHGRVIGDNITGGDSSFRGVMGTTVFKMLDYNIARTGLTEKQATQQGYDVVTSLAPGPDRAHYYPMAKTILVKLVAEKSSGKLLGAQVVGPGEAAKRIDVIATAMNYGVTIDDINDLDLGYAPPYSSAIDNIMQAANVLRNKRDGIAQGVSPQELKRKLDARDDMVLLDVRTGGEYEQTRLQYPRVVWIPLGQLRKRVDELPRDKEIIAFCKISLRGYEAQTILNGAGFKNVKFLDGGLVAWPYPLQNS